MKFTNIAYSTNVLQKRTNEKKILSRMVMCWPQKGLCEKLVSAITPTTKQQKENTHTKAIKIKLTTEEKKCRQN